MIETGAIRVHCQVGDVLVVEPRFAQFYDVPKNVPRGNFGNAITKSAIQFDPISKSSKFENLLAINKLVLFVDMKMSAPPARPVIDNFNTKLANLVGKL